MTKSNSVGGRKGRAIRPSHRQAALFSLSESSEVKSDVQSTLCDVVSVGKRRDGGTRYWCLRHKADATAKYGRPASQCRTAHIPPISAAETLALNIDKYEGGIALWGAVPAVYDTTRLPMDRGIHVHARVTEDAKKEMDCTFRAVRILSDRLSKSGILVSELDAIYYMVTSVFGYEMKHVTCSYCGYPHLDRDWFSLHPHRRHLCAGCGKHFRDTEIAIGNPIFGVREVCGIKTHKPRPSKRKLAVKQGDFPGGIQIWGSNPAFMWTSDRNEEEGVHVHAFREIGDQPDLDETYGEVTIDGVDLPPAMVRVLMAQNALPSLKNRVLPIDCPSCREPQFSLEELAFTPTVIHSCSRCHRQFSARGRLRKTIANPLPGILARLAENAPRKPQNHDLGLMPEIL
jgi:hypothetical protein